MFVQSVYVKIEHYKSYKHLTNVRKILKIYSTVHFNV